KSSWLQPIVVACVLVIVMFAAIWCVRYPYYELPLKSSPAQFSISPGSSLRSATQQMLEAGVIDSAFVFEVLARIFGNPKNIKAGNYEVEQGITPLQLIEKITRGDYTTLSLTFVEGWTFRQMRKTLDDHPSLNHETRGLNDRDVLKRLGVAFAAAEGLFFPDTYHFTAGASDLSVLKRSYTLMQKHLAAQWEQRAPGLPLTSPYQALILASIVEKETGKAADRTTISAVFINRLKLGMRLQTDPTVIYGMGERFDGNLRKQDLLTDTPFNTYTRSGMPPTPIAMPGLGSLRASLHPASSDALYFVARGDGSSHFSRSLEEHDRAVNKYQRSGKR
ncbi:MAG: endolytic transglycosylase MltG, partial [Pseudomonadota bacterium]